MSQSFPWKTVAAALLAGAALLATLPGESLESLLAGLRASVGGARYGELMVYLSDSNRPSPTPFVHTVEVTREDVTRLRDRPQDIPRSDLVLEAKKKFAEKRGYGRQMFGGDNTHVIGGLRVERVELKQSATGQIETLYGRRLAGSGGAAASFMD